MAAVLIAIFISVIGGVVPNIALPTIANEFGIDAAKSVWVVSAYQITVAAGLLPIAALSEIVGLRRIYLAGLLVIIVACVACTFAHTLSQLVAARILQGL